MRHFLDLLDLSPNEINTLLEEAVRLKARRIEHSARRRRRFCLGRVLGLVFEKPSLCASPA